MVQSNNAIEPYRHRAGGAQELMPSDTCPAQASNILHSLTSEALRTMRACSGRHIVPSTACPPVLALHKRLSPEGACRGQRCKKGPLALRHVQLCVVVRTFVCPFFYLSVPAQVLHRLLPELLGPDVVRPRASAHRN